MQGVFISAPKQIWNKNGSMFGIRKRNSHTFAQQIENTWLTKKKQQSGLFLLHS